MFIGIRKKIIINDIYDIPNATTPTKESRQKCFPQR